MNLNRRENITNLKNEGKTSQEISSILNIGLGTVGYYFKILGLNNEKLNNEEIENVIELYNKRKTFKEISSILNLDFNLIKNYIKNKKILKPKITKEELKIQKTSHVVNWKKRKKNELVEYKGGNCEFCGYNKCIEALEFHHKDPNEKDFNISGSNFKIETLKKEVDKCLLLCSNCHREEHVRIKNNVSI